MYFGSHTKLFQKNNDERQQRTDPPDVSRVRAPLDRNLESVPTLKQMIVETEHKRRFSDAVER